MPGLLQEGVPASSQWGVWTCAGPKGAAPNCAEPAIAAGSAKMGISSRGQWAWPSLRKVTFRVGCGLRLAKPDQGS